MNQVMETLPAPRRRPAAVVTRLTAAYWAVLLGLWALLEFGADRCWLGTVLMFGPAWLAAVALLMLVPPALFVRWGLLWPIAAGLVFVGVALTGFNVPLPDRRTRPAGRVKLRLQRCNIHWSKLRPAEGGGTVLGDLIRAADPDVVTMQGWSPRYQAALFEPGRWHLWMHDEVIVASRYPVTRVVGYDPETFPRPGAFACFRVETPGCPFHVCSLHLASPRTGLDAVLRGGWQGADEVRANTKARRRQSGTVRDALAEIDGPYFVAGDFNTPTESALYKEFWSPYANAFTRTGWGWGKTFFTRFDAVRIDHLLASPEWRCRACRVGSDVGSPHRPVLAEWEFAASD
jgi:endonuclease/exonuclease/phosphatase (EEP) superfamily protein YafD